MDCNFSGHVQRTEITVRIDAQETPQRDLFWYLGSIIKDGLGKMSSIGKMRDG